MKVIGVAGHARAGKDTIAGWLVKERGFTVTKLPEAELKRWHERVASVGEDWAKTMDSTNRPGTALLKALREVKVPAR